MTHDEFIRMARDAGFQEGWTNLWAENFERFAAMAASAEREACAKVCEEQERCAGDAMTFYTAAGQCAAAIRARNEPRKAQLLVNY